MTFSHPLDNHSLDNHLLDNHLLDTHFLDNHLCLTTICARQPQAVPSARWGEWMPIVMIGVFNVGDLVGKSLPFLPLAAFQPQTWTEAGLLKFAFARLPLIPILILSVTSCIK
jgi:hypothetical protein